VVIPHGNYIRAYPNDISRNQARKHLGFEKRRIIFLFLGNIRPYKGIKELISAFNNLNGTQSELVIAGQSLDQELEQNIFKLSIGNPKICFMPGFVEDDRMQLFMNAADAVVFPYRDILTSGAVVLAMSFGKACIAPRLGCIPDVLDSKGAFLYEPKDQKGLQNALEAAINSHQKLSGMGQHNFGRAKAWSWDRVAAATLAVYKGPKSPTSKKI
jgi:glycosyltransferase involved in cell wall biosynthesis